MSIIERQQACAIRRQQIQRLLAEGLLEERAPFIVEAHKTAIKRCVPMGDKQQPVENVQSLGIATAFRPWHDVAGAQKRLIAEGIETAYLDGRTRDRESVIDSFRTGTAPVFLISLKAGGFGLTLTEADYVFVLDPWWNPAAELQAIDRTHRIGQDKPVNVYRLVSADTIEEKVVALQQRKRDLFDSVVGSDANLAAPLSAADIRGLLEAD